MYTQLETEMPFPLMQFSISILRLLRGVTSCGGGRVPPGRGRHRGRGVLIVVSLVVIPGRIALSCVPLESRLQVVSLSVSLVKFVISFMVCQKRMLMLLFD